MSILPPSDPDVRCDEGSEHDARPATQQHEPSMNHPEGIGIVCADTAAVDCEEEEEEVVGVRGSSASGSTLQHPHTRGNPQVIALSQSSSPAAPVDRDEHKHEHDHEREGAPEERFKRVAEVGGDMQNPPTRSSRGTGGDGAVPPFARTAGPSLSLPLRALYACNGFSLALQYMPLMYIINTQVELPLTYLPTYGSIAFFPWCLKPLYAVMCKPFDRPTLMITLFAVNAVMLMWYLFLEEGAVVLFFLLVFVRGTIEAWAEFCVGLYLIDESSLQPSQFEANASAYQSQAATSRNVGAFLAGTVSSAFFLYKQLNENQQTGMNRSAAIALLFAASFSNVLSALLVWASSKSKHRLRGTPQETMPIHLAINLAAADDGDDDAAVCLHVQHPSRTITDSLATIESTTVDSIVPKDTTGLADYNSESSYSSHDDSSRSSAHGAPRTSFHDASPDGAFADEYNDGGNPHPSHTNRFTNMVPLVLLQLAVVAFSLKGPIVHLTSDGIWFGTVTVLTAAIFSSGIYIAWSGQWSAKLHGTSLFLILRHAMPGDGMLMSSFMYTAFSSAPVYLQVHGLVGSLASVVSAWSYGRYLSKFSRGAMLRWVIVFTTVLTSVVSLSNVAVVRNVRATILGHQAAADDADTDTDTDTDTSGNEDSKTVNFPFSIFVLSLITSVLTTFTEEWSFLPDIILATSSVEIRSSNGSSSATRTVNRDALYAEVENPSHTRNVEMDGDSGNVGNSAGDATTANDRNAAITAKSNAGLEYGAFISCLDFGDQLGALLASPLVASLGINRDNGWENYDKMILICSIFGVCALAFLTLLPRDRERPSRSSSYVN